MSTKSILFATILVLVTSLVTSQQNPYPYNPNILSKFNHFNKVPNNNEQIQTGGRLIERHYGYLYEAGFNSVLSIVEFPSNDTIYNGVSGNFPSSAYEMSIVNSYGMAGQYLPSSLTVESVKSISEIIDSMPKPLYVHCHVGYTADLFVQLHLYLKQQITSDEIFANSLLLGYDYQNNSDVVNLINSLTGQTYVTTAQSIELTLAEGEQSYKSYYWTHRLGESDNWYNVGQILSTHVDVIQSAGYKTVLCYRSNGEPTSRLPNETTLTGSIPNEEFSDEHGNYQVQEEKTAFLQAGIQFIHLPLNSSSSNTWTTKQFYEYLPILKRLDYNGQGPVLVHCASGYRSSAFTLTYLAYEQKFCSDWVFHQAKDVGFNFNSGNPSASDLQVMNFVKEVLQC